MTNAIVTQALTVYRDYVVDGVFSSGFSDPAKSDIRTLWSTLGPILDSLGVATAGAYIGKTTLALLNADLAHAADTIGEVISDSTPANNGLYLKSGASGSGAWTQVSTLTLPGLQASLTSEASTRSTADALLAPLANPVLTGNPTAPTQSPGTNNTRLANTAYADAATAVEAAARSTADALKAPLDSPALTGNPTVPNQAALNNSTRAANTAYADAAVAVEVAARGTAVTAEASTRAAADTAEASTRAAADATESAARIAADVLLAPLASPALTGNPTAPTQAAGSNNTRLANTAYADGAVASIATKFTSVEGATLLAFTDADDFIYAQIDMDGTLEVANLKSGDGEVNVLETTDGPAFRVTDADDFVLFEQQDTTAFVADVTAAHGSTASLTARLAVNTQDDGTMFSPYWGLWRLRQSRMKMSQLARGLTGVQLVVSLVGDSQFNNLATAKPITQRLRLAYQDAHGGYIGLQSPYLRPYAIDGEYTTTMTGTWTETQYTSPSPHTGKVSSTTAGDKVTVVGPGTSALTGCTLIYIPTANGQAQYRWNGGSWFAVSLTSGFGTVGAATLAIGNLPGSGFGTLEFQVVSGTVQIAGFFAAYANDGVRVNKLGAPGSAAAGWVVQVVKPEWQSIMAAFNTDLYVVQLSTNDQVSRTPQQIAADILTIVTALKTTSPAADVLVMQSPENQNGRATLMSDITAAVRGMCVANKIPFLDLMYAFGDTVADYSVGSPHDWQSDLTHPNPDGGGDAGAELFWRALTSSI